ncbi:hypothetical protein JTE90_022574 [Oedothorax gibbosus]|uniref:Uncharacterized protein n=1 Tax=Oedothorax gibbosus TaxID=931172 RepID=A0AAV6TEN6_9ARAC|nr:hypothetical protein JTE90_022574 [Oedothorax gibbosus]
MPLSTPRPPSGCHESPDPSLVPVPVPDAHAAATPEPMDSPSGPKISPSGPKISTSGHMISPSGPKISTSGPKISPSPPGPKSSPSSPPLDENWSLVFSQSLSQRATYSRSVTLRPPSQPEASSESDPPLHGMMMSAIPLETPPPPVANRTRGKTMMTASDKCASLFNPPLPASPSPTVFLTPHTHRNPSPNPVPVLVSPTSSPVPLGLTDEQAPRTRSPSAPSPSPTRCIPTVFHAENTFPPSLSNPSSSLPLDPSWSLTSSPPLSQKAKFPKAKSPSPTQRPETSPVTVQDSPPTVASTHLPEPPPPSIPLEENKLHCRTSS